MDDRPVGQEQESQESYQVVGRNIVSWLFSAFADAVEAAVRGDKTVGNVRRAGEKIEDIRFYKIGTEKLPNRVSCRGEGSIVLSILGVGYIRVKLVSFVVFSIPPDQPPPYLWSDITLHSLELQVTDVSLPDHGLSLAVRRTPLFLSPARWGISGEDLSKENLPLPQVIQLHLLSEINAAVNAAVSGLHVLSNMRKVETILPWWANLKGLWDEFVLEIASDVESEIKGKLGSDFDFYIKPHPLPNNGIYVEAGPGTGKFSLYLVGNIYLDGFLHSGNKEVNLSKVNLSPLTDIYKLRLSLFLPMPDTTLHNDITFSVTDDYISNDGRHHTSVLFHVWLSSAPFGKRFDELISEWEIRISDGLLKHIEGEIRKVDVIAKDVKEHMTSTYTYLIGVAIKNKWLTGIGTS